MASPIICPNCKTEFDASESFRVQVETELRSKMESWQNKKQAEFAAQQEAFQQQLNAKEAEKLRLLQEQQAEAQKKFEEDKKNIELSLQAQLTEKIAQDFQNKIQLLQQSEADNNKRLQEFRTKEMEYMQREQELRKKEEERELEFQKKLIEEKERLKQQIAQEELQKNAVKETEMQLKTKELEKQLEDQKKLVEEMRRKVEQGSMQLQGEAQELILEELLRQHFPFDLIEEVSKGVRGADCMQIVRNQFGQECGKIIFESKRTQHFGGDWIEKLKGDMRNVGADIAVIVTQAMPKEMPKFGEKDGVYICNFHEAIGMAGILRNALLKLAEAKKSQENKGDKMVMLYDYLTSNEFNEQWKAVREGFMNLKLSIQNERNTMERLWKQREKQLEKILLNSIHIQGSIEGIAGSNIDFLLEDKQEDFMLDD